MEWKTSCRSHTGINVFVVQVEQYNTNSLSLAGVNRLCKHFTLRIDFFKQPRKEKGHQDWSYFSELLSRDYSVLTLALVWSVCQDSLR